MYRRTDIDLHVRPTGLSIQRFRAGITSPCDPLGPLWGIWASGAPGISAFKFYGTGQPASPSRGWGYHIFISTPTPYKTPPHHRWTGIISRRRRILWTPTAQPSMSPVMDPWAPPIPLIMSYSRCRHRHSTPPPSPPLSIYSGFSSNPNTFSLLCFTLYFLFTKRGQCQFWRSSRPHPRQLSLAKTRKHPTHNAHKKKKDVRRENNIPASRQSFWPDPPPLRALAMLPSFNLHCSTFQAPRCTCMWSKRPP